MESIREKVWVKCFGKTAEGERNSTVHAASLSVLFRFIAQSCVINPHTQTHNIKDDTRSRLFYEAESEFRFHFLIGCAVEESMIIRSWKSRSQVWADHAVHVFTETVWIQNASMSRATLNDNTTLNDYVHLLSTDHLNRRCLLCLYSERDSSQSRIWTNADLDWGSCWGHMAKMWPGLYLIQEESGHVKVAQFRIEKMCCSHCTGYQIWVAYCPKNV